MSVVVVGMEMPMCCWDCPMNSFGVCNVVGKIWDPDPGQPKKPIWCPLRPLPEKHGRLADLDAIIRELRSGRDDAEEGHDGVKKPGSSLVLELLIGYLDGRPTIVEAEGEDA